MIHGYHATFSTFGSYLPNDPRGSKSKFVGGRKLYKTAGGVTSDIDRKWEQLDDSGKETLQYAQRVLKRPAVIFTETRIAIVSASLGTQLRRRRLIVWAAALMPCHVHLVLARCQRKAEDLIDELKNAAAAALTDAMVLPTGCDREHSPWTKGRWIRFLDSEAAIENASAYVVENPVREGRPSQDWPFVTPFRGLEYGLRSYGDPDV